MFMTRKRYPNTPLQNLFKWVYFCIFVFITAWLLSSIFLKKSPVDLFKTSQAPEVEKVSYESLVAQLYASNNELDSIVQKLAICRGEKQYKKAMIDIESDHINMRSGPSLSSSILLQIPDSSIVQIQYFDTERYILDGVYGSWCRILYAEEEGWVWGNFLMELD